MLTTSCVALLFATSAQARSLTFQPALVKSIQLPSAVVISSDGKFVYVAKDFNLDTAAIEMYTRDTATGALMLRQTYDGVSGLVNPWALTLNPDQTQLYVVNRGSLNGSTFRDSLVVFIRDTATGALTFTETHTNNANGVSDIAAPVSVTVSPDGAHVYIAGMDDNAVTFFARNVSGNGLTFVESYKNGVGSVDALLKPASVALSPDGAQLYVTASEGNAVVTFARDALTGKLQWQQALFDGANGVDGLAGAAAVVPSPDGKFIYVAGEGDSAIAVLARDVQSGMLSSVGLVKNGVNGLAGLTGVVALAMSTDGFKLHAMSPVDNALTVFARNPLTGALTWIESYNDNVNSVDALYSVFALVASSDGANVYTLSREDKLGVFTAPSADLVVRVDTLSGVVAINRRLHYDFTVVNNGLAEITEATLSVQFPATLNVTVTSPSQGTCIPSPTASTCAIGRLPSGGVMTVGVDAFPAQTQLARIDVVVYSSAHDPNTANNTLQMQISVLDNNNAPVARNDTTITLVEHSVVIDVLSNDSDADVGDALVVQSWDVRSLHNGAVEKLPDGMLRYTPASGYTGLDSFSYTVADTQGATATAQVEVVVNTAPVATGDAVSTQKDTAITIFVTANDSDMNVGDVLSVTAVDPVSKQGGVVEIILGSQYVTYTPASGFTGVDEFNYTVTDGNGAFSNALVTVVVGGGVAISGDGPDVDVNATKNKGGGSIELWSLLCLAGGIACARAYRRRIA